MVGIVRKVPSTTNTTINKHHLLELLRMGTYIEYPYLEFHEYRAQVLLLVLPHI
jgi:hypothetical protein